MRKKRGGTNNQDEKWIKFKAIALKGITKMIGWYCNIPVNIFENLNSKVKFLEKHNILKLILPKQKLGIILCLLKFYLFYLIPIPSWWTGSYSHHFLGEDTEVWGIQATYPKLHSEFTKLSLVPKLLWLQISCILTTFQYYSRKSDFTL